MTRCPLQPPPPNVQTKTTPLLMTRESKAQFTEINQDCWRLQRANATSGGCGLPFEKRPSSALECSLPEKSHNKIFYFSDGSEWYVWYFTYFTWQR